MSTVIAGHEGGVTITRFGRGNGKLGYQVTWLTTSYMSGDRQRCYTVFDSEEKARAFYHLLHLALNVEGVY